MAIKVLVPRLGEGVDELTVVKWLKKEGEAVRESESLLEVETDKVVTEIPSPAGGALLKILVPENTPARVGETLAWIGVVGEEVNTPALAVEKGSVANVPEALKVGQQQESLETDVETRRGFLSPIVRKLAAEKGINLDDIHGTGMNGRVTKLDVLNYSEKDGVRHEGGKGDRAIDDELIPLSTIRKQIAERMQISKQVSPHVMTAMEADLTRVVAHRQANREGFSANGVHLTYTAYFIAAIAAGLRATPIVNSSWTEKGILVHKRINIGMATSLGEAGLIVPVIERADEISLQEIAKTVNDLATRARAHKLSPNEVRGGTFTLTNHGIGGSLFAMPIINQPQCGILGVGAMQKRAVVVQDGTGQDAIAIRPTVYLSLVFDHRILDGALADAFLKKVKETLENWV